MYSPFSNNIPNRFSPCSPSQALPATIAKYVGAVANEIGVDQDMVAITTLAAANSLLLGATCEVTHGFEVGSSIYFAVGAPPSSGKTPCVEKMLRVYNSLIRKYFLPSDAERQKLLSMQKVLRAREKQLLKTAARAEGEAQQLALVNELADVQSRYAEIKIRQSPLIGQVSLNSLTKELANRNGLAFNFDAEGGIFARANSVVKELLSPILKAWSSEELSDVTKKASYRAEKPSLTIAALWQDKPLKAFLRDSRYYDIGLVARVLPYTVKHPISFQIGNVSQECEQQFVNVLERILQSSLAFVQSSANESRFLLSTDARECLKLFKEHSAFLRAPEGLLAEYPEIAGKMDVQAVKLAMILHALDGASDLGAEIPVGTMEKACRLVSFFVGELSTILRSTQENKLIEEGAPLIKALIEVGESLGQEAGITIASLKRALGFSKTKCDRLMFWLLYRNAVLYNRQLVTGIDGKSVLNEFWYPNVLALKTLLD